VSPAAESSLAIGLKEWAAVCRALAEGRQIILLRKGGIHEAAGQFELAHPRFLLFPTYLHQNLAMLKPWAHVGFEPMSAEPARIQLSIWAAVTDILPISHRAQIDAINDEHVWTSGLIDMRFNYRPDNPLYLLLLRAHVLPHSVEIANTSVYGGCKSWVPLDQPVPLAGSRSVLGDDEYQSRRGSIIKRIESNRSA
jgi:hypothetical protein